VVYARDYISVEWYSTLGELIDGLMKNAFAGLNYSLLATLGSTAALVLMNVWPFVALFMTGGAVRVVNGLNGLLIMCIFQVASRGTGIGFAYVLAYPAAALLFAYIIWRSALMAVWRGSVTWRGTAYPLAQLRANRV
jgi:hypothetical protein